MIYEAVDEETRVLAEKIREEFFPEYGDARIEYVYDTRESKKNFIAKIVCSNDLLRYHSATNAESEGVDYTIIFDRVVFRHPHLEEEWKKRIIRHEFRHIKYDPSKPTRKQQYRLRDHDIHDFREELLLAQQEGDMDWMYSLQEFVNAIYEAEE